MTVDCVAQGTVSTGIFKISGLNVAGRHSLVSVDNTTWTPLPASALANRNAIAIQNRTGQEIKLNFDPGIVGYVGVAVQNFGERQYDITDAILIYAKSSTSAVVLDVEELS